MINGKKNISIVGIVGLPPSYGGFETLADNLVKNRDANCGELVVYCSSKATKEKPRSYCAAKLKYLPLEANGWQSILYDFLSIILACKDSKAIIMLGVSGAPAVFVKKILGLRTKIIVNIDGLEWKREKWGRVTKWLLKYFESIACRYADVVVADNLVIKEYVQREYGVSASYIAYGGDHLSIKKDLSFVVSDKAKSFGAGEYSYGLCRIVPENKVHTILEAFSMLPNENLVFVGEWQDSEYARNLFNKYSEKYSNIMLLGGLYDNPTLKTKIRSNAKAYAHGHSAGGTSPALVEAMFQGNAIFTYDCDYNRETTGGCAAVYYKDARDLKSLVELLTTERLNESARLTEALAAKRYCWSQIAKDYFDLI